MRTNPCQYADKVEYHLKFITENPKSEDPKLALTKYCYENTDVNGPKVLLINGPSKLLEIVNILRSMEPLKEFKYNQKLCIAVPEKDN